MKSTTRKAKMLLGSPPFGRFLLVFPLLLLAPIGPAISDDSQAWPTDRTRRPRVTSKGHSITGLSLVTDDENWDSGFGRPGVQGTVYALMEYEGKLIAGGLFSQIGNAVASGIAEWDGLEWGSIGTYGGDVLISPTLGGVPFVTALFPYGNLLVAGGFFQAIDSTAANMIASWDGSTWSPLSTGMDGAVRALTIFNGNLIAGGSFTQAGGTGPITLLAGMELVGCHWVWG